MMDIGRKDYFSAQAKAYATFRPDYPDDLYAFIYQYVKRFDRAWDCATGNGQVARRLCQSFGDVQGTDISEAQLQNAHQAPNIHYQVLPAEATSFPDHYFDLITVAQAVHWFDLDTFYKEVNRVGQHGAVLAVWCYKLMKIRPDIDDVLWDFYANVTGPYWDPARKLIDAEYKTIPFPFREVSTPGFNREFDWKLEELSGFLTSWSSTQGFIKHNQYDPVPGVIDRLRNYWQPGSNQRVRFPIYLRLGMVEGF